MIHITVELIPNINILMEPHVKSVTPRASDALVPDHQTADHALMGSSLSLVEPISENVLAQLVLMDITRIH